MLKRKLNEDNDCDIVKQNNFKNLVETDVFITEYVNKDTCSFTGIIKQR